MKINKIDKIKDKYAISLNNQTYVISLFLKTKYKISTEKEFTLQEVLTIIQEATQMYDEILSKKLVKAMTEAEVRQFLLKKIATTINSLILIKAMDILMIITISSNILKAIDINKANCLSKKTAR